MACVLEVFSLDTIYGKDTKEVYLVPINNTSPPFELCREMLRKWSHRFNCLTVYTYGPLAWAPFCSAETPTDADKKWSQEEYQSLLEDTFRLRKQGVFAEEYPNSSVDWAVSAKKFLPLALDSFETACQQKAKDLEWAKQRWLSVPDTTDEQRKSSYDDHVARINGDFITRTIAKFRVEGEGTDTDLKLSLRYHHDGKVTNFNRLGF